MPPYQLKTKIMKKGKIVESPQDFVKGKMYSIEEGCVKSLFRFSHLDLGGDPAFFDEGQKEFAATGLGFHHFFFKWHTFKEVEQKNRIGNRVLNWFKRLLS